MFLFSFFFLLQWPTACQNLKARLIFVPVLACLDPTQPFLLDADASDFGIGAVLSHEYDHIERVVSQCLSSTKEVRKHATTKSCQAYNFYKICTVFIIHNRNLLF